MKLATALLTFLLVFYLPRANAQEPAKVQPPVQGEDVVRVTTNLVQVDAVVTDKNGRLVTDLGPQDFEVFANGHTRQITGFSYVSLNSTGTIGPLREASVNRDLNTAKTLPPERLRPEQVRRTIAILVDDFGLSFESIVNVRNALEKFIVEQTSPSDLVAIIRTSGGPGAMQQFTSDRRQLLSTIKGLRWYSTGRSTMSAVDPMSPLANNVDGLLLRGYEDNLQLDTSGNEFFRGTLGALGFLVQGLGRIPGRKSVVLISDNLPATNKAALISGVTEALDKLIERANQNSVVVYTMDARGLPKVALTADDSQYNLAANQIDKRNRERPMKFTAEQDGLSYLAKQTGGMFVHDTNDLNDGLRRVLEEEQGYYLIAYRPDDADSQPSRERGLAYKVTLRLNRPGLLVRTRSAFHKVTPRKESVSSPKTKEESLREALNSALVQEDVHLKMTALFIGRTQVKILLHVNARDMEFTKSQENFYNGSFDVTAVAFDMSGKVVKQIGRTQTLHLNGDSFERLLRDGFVYSLTLPIVTAGAYQMRLALRDGGSGKVGSDSQFVEVPDLKKPRLTLSGLIVQALGRELSTMRAPESMGASETSSGPAVRRFKAGDMVVYSYLVNGARRNGKPVPDLLSQLRLLRGGREVFVGGPVPLTNAEVVEDGIVVGGTLRLGAELPPGEYFLQLTVTDKSAPADKQSSDQWIDFEIVKKP